MENIVYLCDYKNDYLGNFMSSMIELTAVAEKNGYNIVFILPISAKKKEWVADLEEKCSTIYFTQFSFISLCISIKLILSKLEGKTVVHTHFLDTKNMMSLKLAKTKNTKIICHYRMHVKFFQNNILGNLKKRIRSFIHKDIMFIGISDAVTNDIKIQFSTVKVVTIKNAIFFDRLGSDKSLSLNSNLKNKYSLLVFGTHYYRKGVDLAITAIKKIIDEGIYNLELTIVAHDITDTKKLIDADFGELNFIRLMAPREKVGELYCMHDIFLSPSRSEAFGNAVVEACYCGCKVIASDTKGQNTMKIVPYIYWVKTDSYHDLYIKIKNLLLNFNDKDCLAEEKKAQKKTVESLFSLDIWCQKNINVYRDEFSNERRC